MALAEELAQEALVAALEHWPVDGVPDKPGAWLMTTAKHKALDWLRQRALHTQKQQELGADADAHGDHVVPDFSDALDAARADTFGDDMLRRSATRRCAWCACWRSGRLRPLKCTAWQRYWNSRPRACRRGGRSRPTDLAAGPGPQPLGPARYRPRHGGLGLGWRINGEKIAV